MKTTAYQVTSEREAREEGECPTWLPVLGGRKWLLNDARTRHGTSIRCVARTRHGTRFLLVSRTRHGTRSVFLANGEHVSTPRTFSGRTFSIGTALFGLPLILRQERCGGATVLNLNTCGGRGKFIILVHNILEVALHVVDNTSNGLAIDLNFKEFMETT